MSKRLDETLSDETEKQVVRAILMASFDFEEYVERAWWGFGTILWDDESWYGTGNLGRISQIEETSEIRATGAVFQLSGVPADLITSVSSSPVQGNKAKIYVGFMDEDFQGLIADPHPIFSGTMDTIEIMDGGDTATITINAENDIRDLERPRTRRYTDADQQSRFPGDKGLEYVPSMQDKQLIWGRAPA